METVEGRRTPCDHSGADAAKSTTSVSTVLASCDERIRPTAGTKLGHSDFTLTAAQSGENVQRARCVDPCIPNSPRDPQLSLRSAVAGQSPIGAVVRGQFRRVPTVDPTRRAVVAATQPRGEAGRRTGPDRAGRPTPTPRSGPRKVAATRPGVSARSSANGCFSPAAAGWPLRAS